MKRTLKGSSLMETLVASVIFLTIFMITMNSLTNIARIRLSGVSSVEMENAINDCIKKTSFIQNSAQCSYDYEWGVIEIKIEPYGTAEDIYDATLTLKAKNGKILIYRYLLCSR